jgi:hypothetical protein
MSTEFSRQLLHFTRSVDIVDGETAEYVRSLLDGYMKKIGATFYIALLDGLTINNGPGLGTFATSGHFWSTNGEQHAIPISGDERRHHSLTSYAYDAKRPLWVVEATGGLLTAVDDRQPSLEDRWSERTSLPPFGDLGNLGTARTLVAIPLSHAFRVLGVLSIQFAEHRLPTEAAKSDFQNLANAVAVVISLYQVRQAQMADTARARTPLGDVLQDEADSPFIRPQLFLAYAETADREVMEEIHRALEPLGDAIEIRDWQRNFDPGELKSRLTEAITSCRYAICYFSEPNPAGEPPFVDNPNVLIEAGMLYSLSFWAKAACKGWIPIREEGSPAAPFDLASINTVLVRRQQSPNGLALDRDAFRADLAGHLSGLVQES